MREHYVRPPLLAREAPPSWRRALPYRLASLLVLALVLLACLLVFRALTGATVQDPGVEALTALPGLLRPR